MRAPIAVTGKIQIADGQNMMVPIADGQDAEGQDMTDAQMQKGGMEADADAAEDGRSG